MNELSEKYYQITEHAYRHLAAPATNHMNLGVWPAKSLASAQSQLVFNVLNNLKISTNQNVRILELGSGWGGSREVADRVFPSCDYTGINLSENQIKHSQSLNQIFPHTSYIHGYMENVFDLTREGRQGIKYDGVFGVESVIHIADKRQLFSELSKVAKSFSFAEISIESDDVRNEKLFYPSLTNCISQDNYKTILDGLEVEWEIKDIAEDVFRGWSVALQQIEPSSFKGNLRVLSQFKKAYSALDALSLDCKVKYLLIHGNFKG